MLFVQVAEPVLLVLDELINGFLNHRSLVDLILSFHGHATHVVHVAQLAIIFVLLFGNIVWLVNLPFKVTDLVISILSRHEVAKHGIELALIDNILRLVLSFCLFLAFFSFFQHGKYVFHPLLIVLDLWHGHAGTDWLRFILL